MKEILKKFSLEGKNAVITGGAGILGSVIAKGLGNAGAIVIIADIVDTKPLVEELRKEGINSKGYYLDAMNVEKVRECKDEILKDFKQVDILINAAGGNQKEATTSEKLSFFDLPVKALEKVVSLNLFGGAILPAQIFGKEMLKNKDGGSIINISSMAAFRPLTRTVGYSAAKAAVSNFTQWLAVHFAQEYNPKLRVNALAPGFFLTNQNRFLLTTEEGGLTERGQLVIDHTPMGKFGDPEDLIGACIWLASDTARFVTGIVVPIDGGFSAFSGV
ncbi:MAG: SDR family oxidoreductase [Atribacterota bacterium]|jgi:NAD(P)-dependent dehydrogenase (short-subunit alcohol dehydrogenase family)|nr:SDR family oxidoreductase [Atribacterota bacterium]MDD4896517.1 SDR family oxidoreductase [Atribacterota bacterium]MDD5637880.1 SDR family oxidoreductase [Atribacterota bacterium]